MKIRLGKIIVVFLSFIASWHGYGQIFPVQVTSQVLPPFTPYLSDYTAPGSQRLMIQLRSNDVTLSDYNVKLRVTIEGVGITIRTKSTFVPQPIKLPDGGVPLILYGEDIVEYFNPVNLDFAGLSLAQFQRTGKLPEGVYRIAIEALDFNRNTVVSNKGMSVAWIILNDPPLLNLPRKDNKILIIDPVNIPFSWTPRHTASPNAAFSTEYIFRLVEIWPANRNPYDAFLSQPPLYEVTTSQSQIIYGPGEPALIPGRKYAWQVQAIDTEGRDLFKNQGRSEVFVFQYGDELGTPENLRSETANAATISIRWEASAVGEMPDQYRVRYKSDTTDRWLEVVSTSTWTTLTGLAPESQYDVQVRAERQGRTGEYSRLEQVSTIAPPPQADYACGTPPSLLSPDSASQILLRLAPGDLFTCSDFTVTVLEVKTAVNGTYSGRGLVQVKMLNGASVEVNFNGSINSNHVMTFGSVVSTYQRGSQMARVIDEMYSIGETPPPPPQQDSTQQLPTPTYVVPGVIDSVFVNAEGKIEVIDEEGNHLTFEQRRDSVSHQPLETVLEDSQGNSYTVAPDGTVTRNFRSGSPQVAGVTSDPVKDRLIVTILQEFDSEISAWLRVNGKGGDEDSDISLAYAIPDQFPKDADFLIDFNTEVIGKYRSEPALLRAKIEENSSDKSVLDDLATSFRSADSVSIEQLTEERHQVARDLLATKLIEVSGGVITVGDMVPECGLTENGRPKPLGAKTLIRYPSKCDYITSGLVVKYVQEGFGKYLCAQERFDLIKCLAEGAIPGEQEDAIIKLLEETVSQQKPALVSLLRGDNTGVLYNIEDGFDFGNYVTVFQKLNELYITSMPVEILNTEIGDLQRSYINSKTQAERAMRNVFAWFEGGILKAITADDFVFARFDDVQIAEDGTISFRYATNPTQTTETLPLISVKPFQLIGFRVRGNANEVLQASDDFVYVPAIMIPALVNQNDWLAFNDAINATMLMTGFSGIVSGSARLIIAGGVDVLFGGVGLVVENYKDDILAMQYGREFIDKYVLVNQVFMAYWSGKLLIGLGTSLPKLATAFSTFKSSDDFARLQATNPSKARQIRDEVETILARGRELIDQKVLSYEKLGTRESINLTSFVAKVSDQYLDVIIHFEDGKFVASFEQSGRFVEQALDAEQLASIINRTPSDKSVRLLSCNDLQVARELSVQLHGRPLYASDGWVDLYTDGVISSQNRFKKIVNGSDVAEMSMEGVPASGSSKIRLGAANNVVVFSSFSKAIEFGGDIVKRAGKKLNILGRAYPLGKSMGTKKLFDELVAKGLSTDEITGLFQRMPEEWSATKTVHQMNSDYWELINKVHIDNVIANGGDIRFIHDPRLETNKWNLVSNMDPAQEFTKKCVAEKITRVRTFLNMEYEYLLSKGYVLQENGLMTKP